ncbi:MAG: cache domain-containing protein [Motiliproteus sp.]|nr:cache domain-containing protein [Motiliproteus sp.]MCW9053823.1 cache domain-containing protein [Motiliproteus sp.]
MIFKSKLVQRFFSVILVIVALFYMAVYLYSVPLIKDTVYDIERNASRIALNNVFELANKMYFNLETYRAQALENQKRQLKTVVSLAEAYTRDAFNQVELGFMSREEARERVFEGLRNFTYGNKDYVWVSSYDAVLLSHPDPRFHGADASSLKSNEGQVVIPRIIKMAQADGDGYYQYKWRRLGEPEEIDKISYVKNFPEWGIVIGSGLYLDDIEAEVRQRTETAIAELREALAQIKIAKTGYLYIFDANYRMFIHPNPNLDGVDFRHQLNPVTQHSIAEELVAVADTGRELHYKWDKPSDPGNYVHEKISLVRHLEGFDWYIGSSVYVDELRRSSELLSERILTIALIGLGVTMVLAFFFVSRVTSPITRLAETASRVSEGDLTAQSGIQRDDELGVLARTFDDMVKRLSGNILTLDQKVKTRTQELATIEERQRLILDALPAQIAYVGKDLRYRFVNQGYADMFSMSKEDAVGRKVGEVMGEQMLEDIWEPIQNALNGEESMYEYPIERNGETIITKRILIPHRTADGFITGMLNLSLDITAEKEAERKLTEAQRMNAVGQLAGGLAHDFNNLLTIVLGNLNVADEKFRDIEGLQDYLKPALRASRRSADITSRLLAFSRRQPLTPASVNVETLVTDSIGLINSTLPCNIQVNFEPTLCQGAVYADPSQLENALVNLALNARDAMPRGGELSFRVEPRTIRGPVVYDEAVEPGDYIEIQVLDSGEGFSEESMLRAFEPFFTTKPGGAGSGLGLSMVYGFVKQSSGYIRLQSAPGEGATVSLLLPAHSEPEGEGVETAEPAPGESFQGELMLLVEDDADVREVVRAQLTSMGFAVLEATDAEEALELAGQLDQLYGVVSDVMMPGSMDGFDLARELRTERPDCRIVLITGYSFDKQPTDDKSVTLLRKPFEQEALQQAIIQARL